MNDRLFRALIKNYDATDDPEVRDRYLYISSVLGIVINFILFAAKAAIGFIMGSISVLSDGVNNLSDMLSSFVAVIGVKLSSLPPDEDHPQGHGRFEYIASFIVSIIILFAGFELCRSSIGKIRNPVPLTMNRTLVLILVLSVLPKIYLYYMNRYVGKTIDSTLNLGLAKDSMNDVFSTGAVILSSLITYYTSVNIDGIAGLVVSVLIMKSGYDLAKETVDLLLGKNPEPELVPEIKEIILGGEYIIGVHDIVINNFGRGNIVCSAHAEVPKNISVDDMHRIIDQLEKEVKDLYKVDLVLHMDPVYFLQEYSYEDTTKSD